MTTKHFIHNYVYKPFLKTYLRFNTNVHFDAFNLSVFKGVFHPGLFFSTKYLYDFLKRQELHSKTFLEVGCGSGLLSLLAYKKGAQVTALDIDPNAVKNTELNFIKNFGERHTANIIQSNLYRQLPAQSFDLILINPPYFFKKVTQPAQHAWYCGEDGAYFEELFSGLKNYIHRQTQIVMILAENCDIERIRSIAGKYACRLVLKEERKIRWEKNYIFNLLPDEH